VVIRIAGSSATKRKGERRKQDQQRNCIVLPWQKKRLAPECLLYMDAVGGVVSGHVGEDDLVAFFESIEDFDGVDGRAA
jgi:hypothetical protein